nr:retrovirus-related Pol polyprotein from transposon TNT 1-94 [Tanacetum cinerariifolium]
MVGSWFRMFKGDIIRLRGTLLEEIVQLAMGEHILELGMSMQPKHQQNFDYFKDKMLLMQAQENGAVLDEEELLFLTGEQTNNFDAYVDDHPPKRQQNFDYFKDKMLLMQAQENGAVLDEEDLLFLTGEQTNNFDAYVDDHPVRDLALNDDNILQANECDAFDSDVDDEPSAQSIFIDNLSSARPTNQQAGKRFESQAVMIQQIMDTEVIGHVVIEEVQMMVDIDETELVMIRCGVEHLRQMQVDH